MTQGSVKVSIKYWTGLRYWRQIAHISPGLTHWGRVTHICVGNLTIIGSDNGLTPARRQAITWTNVGILLIGPIGTNFSEKLIEIHTFTFKKIHLNVVWKMAAILSSPQCVNWICISNITHCGNYLGKWSSCEWFCIDLTKLYVEPASQPAHRN